MGDNEQGKAINVEIRIVELPPEEFEKYIEFDSMMSWEFIDEEIRNKMTFEDYKEIHRRLVSIIYFSNLDNRIFAAIKRDDIIGIAWVGLKIDTINYIPIGYLYDIEVREDYRRSGLGSKLMYLVEEACKEWSVDRIVLSVDLDNKEAYRWYLKRGYHIKRLIMTKILR